MSQEQLLYIANQYFDRRFSIAFYFHYFSYFEILIIDEIWRQNKIGEMVSVVTDTFHLNNSPLPE